MMLNLAWTNGIAYTAVGNRLVATELVSGEILEELVVASGTITDMSRDGDLLYTMDSARSLRAIDISGLALAPRSSLTLPNGGSNLFVGGGIAYASNVNTFVGGFATVDVSDPDSLTLISDVDTPAGIDSSDGPIAANGSGLAVQLGRTVGDSVLSIYDVSDPINTDDLVTQIELPRQATGVSLAGGIAIVSDGTAGVQVVNFLPFDVAAVAPTVTVTTAFADIDPGTPGIQVVEGTTLPFELDVTDDVQARSTELLIDGIPFASDITFPFNLSTVGLDLGNGDSMVTAQVRVRDSGGNTTVSPPIEIEFVPDTIAPTIASINPVDGAEISRLQRQFRIVFDEPIAVGSVNEENIQLVDPSGQVVDPEFIALSFNDTVVTISYPELVEGEHELRINDPMIMDRVGNALGASTKVSSFDVIQSTAFWIGGSGNFNDPSNWNTGVVPGPDDDVLINVPGDQVITITANHTLAGIRSSERLFVGGGSLQVTGAGDLFAGVDHAGGNLGGSAAIRIYGDSTMTGGAIVGAGGVSNMGQLTVSGASPFVNGTLTNFGTITTSASNFYLNNGTINNLADATFEIQSGTVDFWNGSPSIQNDGTILKTGADAGTIDVWISHQGGTFDVQEGLLSITRGGQHVGGDYQVAEDATLEFNSSFNIETTMIGRGAGTIALNSIWLVPDGEAAVFDIAADLLQWNGSLNIDGTATNINVLHANGTQPFLRGALNNDATIISSAPNFYLLNGVINNRADGVLEIPSGIVDFWNGTNSINNEGVIRKTGDSTATVDVFVSQEGGTLEVQEGALNLTRGGLHLVGDYQVGDGTELNFNSAFTLTGEVIGTGEGSINLNSTWTVPVGEEATLNFAGDIMQWNGTLDVDGTATNTNVLNASGTQPFLSGTLNNDATIISTAPNFYLLNGVINNRADGVLEIQSGIVDFWNGTNFISNEGVIRKTGDSTGAIDVFISQQDGIIEIEEGILNVTRGGEHAAGEYLVATDTSLNFSVGAFTFAGDVIGTGGGRVNVTSSWQVPVAATFDFAGDLLHWGGSATHTFAGVATNAGTINVSSGTPFLTGTLDNEGTINSNFLYLLSGTINNRVGATIELGTIDLWNGTTAINNEGLIRKTGDSTGVIDVPLRQQGGTVEVEGGILNVTQGGEHTAGDYQVADGSTLNFSVNTFTFAGDVIGTGEGRVNVMSSWQVPVAATFDFAGDLLHWGGSTTHTFAGVATNAGTINVSSGSPFLTGTLDNEGTINSNFLYLLSGTINNRVGGTIELGTIDLWNGTTAINNEGTVFASAGTTAIIDVPFTNNGTIELTEGSLLRFTRSLTLPAASTITARLGGDTIADFGRMSWNSGIFLNGALEVEAVNGFTPMAGDTFNVLSYTSAAGDFSSYDDGGTGLGYEVGGTSVNLGFGLARSADERFLEVSPNSSLEVDEVDDARVRREQAFDRLFANWE